MASGNLSTETVLALFTIVAVGTVVCGLCIAAAICFISLMQKPHSVEWPSLSKHGGTAFQG